MSHRNERMTSKQRVLAALRHEEPDRVPRNLWYAPAVQQKLAEVYGKTGPELLIAVGNDILETWLSINGSMARSVPCGESFIDEWGITWTREGDYNMVTRHPLADADLKSVEQYPLPAVEAESRYTYFKNLIDHYGQTHFIGADVSGSIFEPCYHLRGMENLLMDMALDSKMAEALMDRVAAFTLQVALKAVELGADWIWLGDDLGTQQNMLISPDAWRRFLKPRMRNIIAGIKKTRPEIFIAYHSCGSIEPIIGDLVEIGVQLLNPIQPLARGMDAGRIKRMYGDRLTLMCGIDTQGFLQSASPSAIRDKVRALIRTLGKGGGFIFAASHTIQPDVSPEKIVAVLETLDEQGIL
ncbi:MAG: uroporphyrinogen decarboxylase family protein [Phycisphaerae bacterium]